jgi:hypothetical protein
MVEIVEKVDCPNCGAPLKIKAGEIVVTCEYCGTAVSLRADKPFVLTHSIIPNKFSQEEIVKTVKSWMRSGYAMPGNLAGKAQFKKVELVFLPFYVVTAHAATTFQGVLTRIGGKTPVADTLTGEYEWTVLGRRSSEFPEREYRIPLSGKSSFDLSLVQGEFLNAELDENEARTLAEKGIEANQTYLVREKVDTIENIKTDIEVKESEFLHAPVWFIDYEYRGSTYHVLVDGCTGQIIKGDIPLEESAFPWVWVAAGVVIVMGILLILLR